MEDGGPLAGPGAGGGGAESSAEEVPGSLAVAALVEAAAGLAQSQQGGQHPEGDDVQELWGWGRASALGPPCFQGETPVPPSAHTHHLREDPGWQPCPPPPHHPSGCCRVTWAVGRDVAEVMAGSPAASFTPHPSLSTPPPSWQPHRHILVSGGRMPAVMVVRSPWLPYTRPYRETRELDNPQPYEIQHEQVPDSAPGTG